MPSRGPARNHHRGRRGRERPRSRIGQQISQQDERQKPRPPAEKRFFVSVLDRYDLEQHELVLLREIVRSVDDLDRLANIAGRQGAITAAGDIYPAVAEARQMRMVLATLIGALRLPDERDAADHTSLRRPRRYPPVRSIDPPTPQSQSARVEVTSNGTSALGQGPAAGGRNTAASRAQNTPSILGKAGPVAPPPERRFNPAPASRPPAARQQQVTVHELIAKVRNDAHPSQSVRH